jgi:hypothetical protein
MYDEVVTPAELLPESPTIRTTPLAARADITPRAPLADPFIEYDEHVGVV